MDVPRNASELILTAHLVDDSGDPITGVAFDDASLSVESLAYGDAAFQAVTLVAGTLGTYVSSSWVEIGGGYYQFCPANALIVAGRSTAIRVTYAANDPIAGTINAVGSVDADVIADAVIAGGSASRAITVTVQSSGGTLISGARVSVLTSDGTATGQTKTTGSQGTAVLHLDDDQYLIRVAAPSGYASPDDTEATVDENETPVTITVISTGDISPPDDPLLATLSVKCVDESGAAEEGVTIEVRLVDIPSGGTGIAYKGASQSATSNESGIALLTVVRLATYQVKRGTSKQWTSVTIADEPTTTITSFVGAP